jgi:hypothetical protein
VQWGEPTKPENLLAILRTIVGSEDEAKRVLEKTKTDEVKKLLASNTDQAFKDGAFGLPYFVGEYINRLRSYFVLMICSYKHKGRNGRFLGR